MTDINQYDDNNQTTNESEICGLYVPTIQSLILTIFPFLFTLLFCVGLIYEACTSDWHINYDPEMVGVGISRLSFGSILFLALMLEIKENKTNCYKLSITYLCAAMLLFSAALLFKGYEFITFIYAMVLPLTCFLNQKKYKPNGRVVFAVSVIFTLLTIALAVIIKNFGGIIIILTVLTTLLIVIQAIIGYKINKAYGGALKDLGKWMMIESIALAGCIAAVSITDYAVIVAGVVMILTDFFFYRKFHKALCLCD